MVRKNLTFQALPVSVRTSPTINLLIVTARPSGTHDVGYRTISRPLVEALRQTSIRIQVEILRPGTYRSLENHLGNITAKHGEGHYHVIHFDVHGAVLMYDQFQHIQQEPSGNPFQYKRYARGEIQPYEGVKAFLSFEADSEEQENKSDLVEASELAGLQLVLAMGYSVTVSAAELLMSTLYQRLFTGDDLAIAIRHARTELYNNKERRAYFDQKIDLEDWLLPVVYQNQPVTLRLCRQRHRHPPDREALAHETQHAAHTRHGWHTTGFVQRVFYFGYDEKAWTLQQIMTSIAQQLHGSKYCTDFQPLPLAAQQAMLSQDLRGKNHLLILDNM